MKKSLRTFMIVIFGLFVFAISFSCGSKTVEAKETIKSGSCTIYEEDDDWKEINFKMPKDGIFYVEVDIKLIDDYGSTYTSKGKSYFGLYFNNNDYSFEDGIDYKLSKGGSDYECWYWSDSAMKAGSYTVSLGISDSSYKYLGAKCKYKIVYYSSFATSFKIPSKATVKTDGEKKIKITSKKPSSSLHGATFKSSNTKIAKVWYDASNTVYIYGIKAGKCTITATLDNGKTYKCKVTVKNPKPKINYSSYKLNKGKTVKLKVKYTNKKVKWSSSNKKIATVSSKGKVTAKKAGKCTITGKIGSKKYKCKINVVYREPNFAAQLYEYNTRDNYFVVRFKNYGTKTLKITKGVNVEQDNYKSYDRTISLSKTVSIKPGKSKKVKFKVKGSTSWYNYKTYTLAYKFKYDGKTYTGHTWYDDSVYKRGKSWYGTYYDDYEEKYQEWLQ